MSKRLASIATCCLILGFVAYGFAPKTYPPELQAKFVTPQGVWANPQLAPFEQKADRMPEQSEVWRFRNTFGKWNVLVDERTGHVAFMEGEGIPFIPGTGVGNRVQLRDLAPFMRGPKATVDADTLEAMARNFLHQWQGLFQVDQRNLVLNRDATVQVNPDLWFVRFDYVQDGTPVDNAYFVLRIGHGNLIQIGQERIAPFPLSATPAIPSSVAWNFIESYLDGRILTNGRTAHLRYEPLQVPLPSDGSMGRGYDYRLVWQLFFNIKGSGQLFSAWIDANQGRLLLFRDETKYGQVKGGIYPQYNGQTEVTRNFPYADYGTGLYADLGGFYPGNTGTSKLDGKYVRISDNCGSISLTNTQSGNPDDIDFGTSAGKDCTTPGYGGSGNTHAARMGFYHVNLIKEKGRKYLPSNTWLKAQITANMNINSTCNAYWNGSTINFFKSGGGCNNTGEIAGVFLHEWGHGLDQNDGGGTADGATGEAYGDSTAVLQTHDSCMGRSFLGGNCNGYGNSCTSCTGVRDVDYAMHSNPTPARPSNINGSVYNCPGGSGPCGKEVHCESYIQSQALWDLAVRDLPGAGFDSSTSWQIVDKLWYQSRPSQGAGYSCTGNPQTAGCGAGSLYTIFRAIDDVDGNLNNGTPHAAEIFAALNRHEIACGVSSDPKNQDNAECSSPTAPTLSATPGNNSVALSWNAVAGATEYVLYRNEFSCTAGFTEITRGTSTNYTDNATANGTTYYYRVQATNNAGACASVMSNCATATPASGPLARYVQGSANQTADTGDNDGFPDNCESVTVSFQVENAGTGTLTNVRVTSITSTFGGVAVTTAMPISLGNLGVGGTATGSFDFTLTGAACAQALDFTMLVTANEMSGTSTGNFSFTAEQDLALTNVTYSFETDLEGWTVKQGTFARTSTYGGSAGSFAIASSNGQNNQCDEILSPAIVPTASSTMTVGTHYDIEPASSGQWWDRANIAAFDGTTANLLTPTGGRTYNASGANGTCGTTGQAGWADTAASWADSSGFDITPFAGTSIQLDVRYGTDPLVAGTGFRIDNIRLTNVMALICDTQSDTCSGCPTITLSPTTLPNGTVGVPYSQSITASGGAPPYTYAVTSGTLPAGLTLSSAGLLSGTPTAAATSNFTVTATDNNSCTGSRGYSVTIDPASCPTITLAPTTLPNGTVGSPYNQTITASGGAPPYTYAVTTGTLPVGLTLSSAGVLSGTPTAAATSNFTVTATDNNSCTGSQAYTLTIDPAGCPTITLSPTSLPSGTVGVPYSQTITASGGAPAYTFAVTAGALPGGLALSTAGVLSGTPTGAGTSNFTVTATDQNSCTGSQAYSLVINPAGCGSITISPATLADGAEGLAYSATLTASGGTGPYTYSVSTGQLPPGLSLASSTGAITGTPTTAGDYAFTVTATDSASCSGSASYSIHVSAAFDYLVGEGDGITNTNQVRVYTRAGQATTVSFQAYGAGKWGTHVSSGNINGGTYSEILTGPGPGNVYGPQVRAFKQDGSPVQKVNFYAYGTLRFGVNTAGNELDGDGFDEILSGAGPGSVFGPHVRGWNFDNVKLQAIQKISFFAYRTLRWGVNVENGDVDGDLFGEILTGPGPGQIFGAQIRGWNYDASSVKPMGKINYTAYASYTFGANVASGDLDADGFAEIATAPGAGPTNPAEYRGFNFDGTGISAITGVGGTYFGSVYGGRVGTGDLLADGGDDLIAGPGPDPTVTSQVLAFDNGLGVNQLPGTPLAPFGGTYGVNVAAGALGHF